MHFPSHRHDKWQCIKCHCLYTSILCLHVNGWDSFPYLEKRGFCAWWCNLFRDLVVVCMLVLLWIHLIWVHSCNSVSCALLSVPVLTHVTDEEKGQCMRCLYCNFWFYLSAAKAFAGKLKGATKMCCHSGSWVGALMVYMLEVQVDMVIQLVALVIQTGSLMFPGLETENRACLMSFFMHRTKCWLKWIRI